MGPLYVVTTGHCIMQHWTGSWIHTEERLLALKYILPVKISKSNKLIIPDKVHTRVHCLWNWHKSIALCVWFVDSLLLRVTTWSTTVPHGNGRRGTTQKWSLTFLKTTSFFSREMVRAQHVPSLKFFFQAKTKQLTAKPTHKKWFLG